MLLGIVLLYSLSYIPAQPAPTPPTHTLIYIHTQSHTRTGDVRLRLLSLYLSLSPIHTFLYSHLLSPIHRHTRSSSSVPLILPFLSSSPLFSTPPSLTLTLPYPPHPQVMYDPVSGPCLVEVGSRCHGGEGTWLPVVEECLGYSQLDATLSCYLRPDRLVSDRRVCVCW